jgi:hypothetical protein
MIGLQFTPWRNITAIKDKAAIQRWLQDVASTAHRVFRAGSEASRGGRIYRKRGGRVHRASAPGAWPARDSGGLLGSIRTVVTQSSAEIGTSRHYSGYLRSGTRKMARRKMSDNALREAIPMARGRMGSFARFRAG